MSRVILDVVGPDLASDRGVGDKLTSTFYAIHQFPVHGGIDSDLTEIQFHFDIGCIQAKRYRIRPPHGPQIGGVEVHFNSNLDNRDQQLAKVEDFNVWHEAEDAVFGSSMLGIF